MKKKTSLLLLALCSTVLLAPPPHRECRYMLKLLRQELKRQQSTIPNAKLNANQTLRHMRIHVDTNPDHRNLMHFCFNAYGHGQTHLGEACVPCCKAFLKKFATRPESEYPIEIQMDAEYDPAAGYQQPFLKAQREMAREEKLDHKRSHRKHIKKMRG